MDFQPSIDILAQWGISQQAAIFFGLKWNGRGFIYPSFENHRRRILLANPKPGSPKAIWDKETAHLPMPPLFNAGCLPTAGGTVYVANGEKSTLAHWTAGVKNTINTFGEGNRVGEAVELLKAHDIRRVTIVPDCDTPGLLAALKWREMCKEAGLELIILDLRLYFKTVHHMTPDQFHKWDTRDLWLLLKQDADAFRHALDTLPILEFQNYADELPKPRAQQERLHRTRPVTTLSGIDFAALYDRWRQEVVLPTLDRVSPPPQRGKHRHCPNPLHPDRHPSFRITENGAPVCTCGPITWDMLAQWVGVQSWADYKRAWLAEYRAKQLTSRTIAREPSERKASSSSPEVISDKDTLQMPTQPLPHDAPDNSPLLSPQSSSGDSAPADHKQTKAQIIEIKARYLTDAGLDFGPAGAYAIMSPVGTGKTELIKRIIAEQPPEASILVISHRITLTRELSERFNFENYQGIPASHMGQVKRLVITANSLHKVLGKMAKLPSYHLLVLDEAEQILEHIAGSTFKGAQGVQTFKLLAELVKRTPKVIAGDAGLTDLALHWLGHLRSDRVYIRNGYKPSEKRHMQVLGDERHWLSELVQQLEKAQQPIVICTDSKRKAKDLDKLLRILDYNGKCVHSDSRDTSENREFLLNVDARLPELDYFIYSPTIDAGIDIQAEVEAVFGFFLNRTAAPPIQLQMLGRCRRAQRLIVYSAPAGQLLETSALRIKARVIRNNLENARLGNFPIEWDIDGNAVLDRDRNAYLTLQANAEAKYNYLMRLPRRTFIELARKQYKVTVVKTPKELPNPELAETMEIIRIARRAEETRLILTSPPVDHETLVLAQLRGQVTPELVFGNLRYTYEQFYGKTISEGLLAEAQNRTYGGMARLNRFILLHQDKHYWQALDRDEISQNTADSQRKLNYLRIEKIKEALAVVFGEKLNTERIPIEEFEVRLAAFNTFFEENELGRILNRRTNSADTPLKRFRWLLSLVGLKLKYWRGRNGKREYSLDIDRYQLMVDLANYRIHYSPQLREQERRLGIAAHHVSKGLRLCNATVQEDNTTELHSRVTKSSPSTGKPRDIPPEPFQKPPPA